MISILKRFLYVILAPLVFLGYILCYVFYPIYWILTGDNIIEIYIDETDTFSKYLRRNEKRL